MGEEEEDEIITEQNRAEKKIWEKKTKIFVIYFFSHYANGFYH